MPWVLLIVAGPSEVGWAALLPATNGLRAPGADARVRVARRRASALRLLLVVSLVVSLVGLEVTGAD